MPDIAFTHFAFVDFENVQKVDLSLVEGKPVHVTLLIGSKQTKLDLSLVQQMRRVPEQVELVEVGASGRNALDLTLAFYLGQAAQSTPTAQFSIISKDKDFEAMLSHLSGKGINAVRRDTFASAFQPTPKKPTAAANPATLTKETPEDRLEKLITRLKNNLAPRPKNKARLLAHIKTAYGQKLTDADSALKLDELVRRGVLVIEDKDKIRYL